MFETHGIGQTASLLERYLVFIVNTDAKSCVNAACRSNQFECMNGSCIQLYQRCDGVAHCPDGDDELNCTRQGKNCLFSATKTSLCHELTLPRGAPICDFLNAIFFKYKEIVTKFW